MGEDKRKNTSKRRMQVAEEKDNAQTTLFMIGKYTDPISTIS